MEEPQRGHIMKLNRAEIMVLNLARVFQCASLTTKPTPISSQSRFAMQWAGKQQPISWQCAIIDRGGIAEMPTVATFNRRLTKCL